MEGLREHTPPQGRRGLVRGLYGLASAALAYLLLALCLAPAAEAQRPQFYGVVTQAPGQAGHLQPRDYNLMRDAGVGRLRFMISWRVVETTPRRYNWAGPDWTIGSAAARGIRVLPYVDGPPLHLGTPPTGARDQREFRRFMGKVAERYKPGGDYWRGPYQATFGSDATPLPVRTYQLLNEPNSRFFWGGSPSPRAYGRMVKAGARGVRSQQPRAEIVLGGMFATPSGMKSRRFLSRLYNVKGIKRAFDTVAVHPYAPNLRGIRGQMRAIRKVMRRNNDRAGRTRVTEFGWGSQPTGHRLTKTPEGQARLLRRAFRLMRRQRHQRRWKLRGVTWFSWQDGGGCPYCASSGLVSGPPRDRQLKPSWWAFREISP